MRRKIFGCFAFVIIFVFFTSAIAYGTDSINEARALIKARYYQDVDEKVLEKTDIKDMVNSLNDPYSSYMEPEAFKDFLSSLDGDYVGVGMTINESGGSVQVVKPMPDSPAEKAGLSPGDIITHVDGKSIQGLTSGEVAAKIRGLEGTKVTVAIKRGDRLYSFTMVRKKINLLSLEYRLIGPGIGYINLYSFASDSPQEIEDALNELMSQKMEMLVLDLRDNPGGLLDAAVNIAGNFVPKGPVVHVVQKGNREYVLRTYKTPWGIPVAVLVNEGTASAAEILAGAIQDSKTGFVVGTKTYGKGSVQTIFALGNGGGLKLTTAKYLTRGRQDIIGKGIAPDIIEADKEKQLETAVKTLGGSDSIFDIQMTLGSNLIFVGFRTYQLPVSPFIANGSVMVPLREVAKYLGGDVRWEKDKTIIVSDQRKYEIDPSTKIIKTDQGTIVGKALIKNGYMMVPVRALAETAGYVAGWQKKTQSVYLNNKGD